MVKKLIINFFNFNHKGKRLIFYQENTLDLMGLFILITHLLDIELIL